MRAFFLVLICLLTLSTITHAQVPRDPDAKKAGTVVKNSIGMEIVWIPAGMFMMGSTEAEVDEAFNQCNKETGDQCKRESFAAERAETPRHSVTISRPFLIGKYEVTQGQWQALMGTNPSHFKECGSKCPVEQVSWDDVQGLIRKLNTLNDGYVYRLPTEAEWEYACRAGTTGEYYGELDSIAWYKENSARKTHPVGQKKPNDFGLYDMSGNVWEWVEDWYGGYSPGKAIDPTGAGIGQYRVLRGGWGDSFASGTRSAVRYWYSPSFLYSGIGFRIAATRRQ